MVMVGAAPSEIYEASRLSCPAGRKEMLVAAWRDGAWRCDDQQEEMFVV
jgi:hypothetical protein